MAQRCAIALPGLVLPTIVLALTSKEKDGARGYLVEDFVEYREQKCSYLFRKSV